MRKTFLTLNLFALIENLKNLITKFKKKKKRIVFIFIKNSLFNKKNL